MRLLKCERVCPLTVSGGQGVGVGGGGGEQVELRHIRPTLAVGVRDPQ